MLNATIVKRVNITDTLALYCVKPDTEIPNFLPGQYVALGLLGDAPRYPGALPEKEIHKPDKLIKRTYSIGSSPDEKGYYEFYIAIVPEGALTSRLALLGEGDRIFAGTKVTGTFTLKEVAPESNLILVSTGTGIAPFMSMLRTAPTWAARRKITLINGVRYASDFAYRDELERYVSERPEFKYLTTVSRPDASWTGERGYVQDFFSKDMVSLDPAHDKVFLCGNPAMIEDVEKLLATRGYSVHSKKNPAGNLHLEKYW